MLWFIVDLGKDPIDADENGDSNKPKKQRKSSSLSIEKSEDLRKEKVSSRLHFLLD